MCQGEHTYLEGLDEGPQEVPYSLGTIQQLHQTHHAEESEEGDGHAHVLRRLWREGREKFSSSVETVNPSDKVTESEHLTAMACIGSTACGEKKQDLFVQNSMLWLQSVNKCEFKPHETQKFKKNSESVREQSGFNDTIHRIFSMLTASLVYA